MDGCKKGMGNYGGTKSGRPKGLALIEQCLEMITDFILFFRYLGRQVSCREDSIGYCGAVFRIYFRGIIQKSRTIKKGKRKQIMWG
jgi:hypothetical protein